MKNNETERKNSEQTFASTKWTLTALSGLLTTAFIIFLET
jgi:hypothetical protein